SSLIGGQQDAFPSIAALKNDTPAFGRLQRAVDDAASSRASAQALEGGAKLGAALHRLVATVALLLDDLRRCLGNELRIAELAVDLLGLVVDLGDLLFEPRALRPDVDDAGKWQCKG